MWRDHYEGSKEGGDGYIRVDVLDESAIKMRFVITGGLRASSNKSIIRWSAYVNALRRAIMSEVPTMAMDQLEIHQNTTVMHDELLAHRLGLIPLVSTAVDDLLHRHQCECEDGCERCTATFTLHVINRSDDMLPVTSRDLVALNPKIRPIPSADILLAKLGKNQELAFTAKAVKATARSQTTNDENNSKWNPVSVAAFRPVANIKINAQGLNKFLTPDQQREVCNSEPASVFAYDDKQKCTVAHPEAPLRCVYSGDFLETLGQILHPVTPLSEADIKIDAKAPVVKKDEITLMEEENVRIWRHPSDLSHPLISVSPRSNQFLCTVNSTQVLPPRDIVLRAISAIKKRLSNIQSLTRRKLSK